MTHEGEKILADVLFATCTMGAIVAGLSGVLWAYFHVGSFALAYLLTAAGFVFGYFNAAKILRIERALEPELRQAQAYERFLRRRKFRDLRRGAAHAT